ncbi:MAG: hypothetical protein M3Y55_08840 [Pseudomonadota bacterium]|nr:hypothetical protein [Pseudomonadota bacterium]
MQQHETVGKAAKWHRLGQQALPRAVLVTVVYGALLLLATTAPVLTLLAMA